jgi:hypothetical protein
MRNSPSWLVCLKRKTRESGDTRTAGSDQLRVLSLGGSRRRFQNFESEDGDRVVRDGDSDRGAG